MEFEITPYLHSPTRQPVLLVVSSSLVLLPLRWQELGSEMVGGFKLQTSLPGWIGGYGVGGDSPYEVNTM